MSISPSSPSSLDDRYSPPSFLRQSPAINIPWAKSRSPMATAAAQDEPKLYKFGLPSRHLVPVVRLMASTPAAHATNPLTDEGDSPDTKDYDSSPEIDGLLFFMNLKKPTAKTEERADVRARRGEECTRQSEKPKFASDKSAFSVHFAPDVVDRAPAAPSKSMASSLAKADHVNQKTEKAETRSPKLLGDMHEVLLPGKPVKPTPHCWIGAKALDVLSTSYP